MHGCRRARDDSLPGVDGAIASNGRRRTRKPFPACPCVSVRVGILRFPSFTTFHTFCFGSDFANKDTRESEFQLQTPASQPNSRAGVSGPAWRDPAHATGLNTRCLMSFRRIAIAAGIACSSFGAWKASAVEAAANTVVLVHGAFADGSSWAKCIPLLQAQALTAIPIHNPLP